MEFDLLKQYVVFVVLVLMFQISGYYCRKANEEGKLGQIGIVGNPEHATGFFIELGRVTRNPTRL